MIVKNKQLMCWFSKIVFVLVSIFLSVQAQAEVPVSRVSVQEAPVLEALTQEVGTQQPENLEELSAPKNTVQKAGTSSANTTPLNTMLQSLQEIVEHRKNVRVEQTVSYVKQLLSIITDQLNNTDTHFSVAIEEALYALCSELDESMIETNRYSPNVITNAQYIVQTLVDVSDESEPCDELFGGSINKSSQSDESVNEPMQSNELAKEIEKEENLVHVLKKLALHIVQASEHAFVEHRSMKRSMASFFNVFRSKRSSVGSYVAKGIGGVSLLGFLLIAVRHVYNRLNNEEDENDSSTALGMKRLLANAQKNRQNRSDGTQIMQRKSTCPLIDAVKRQDSVKISKFLEPYGQDAHMCDECKSDLFRCALAYGQAQLNNLNCAKDLFYAPISERDFLDSDDKAHDVSSVGLPVKASDDDIFQDFPSADEEPHDGSPDGSLAKLPTKPSDSPDDPK